MIPMEIGKPLSKKEAHGNDSPKVSYFGNKCNKTVLPRNYRVKIFGEKSSKQPEFIIGEQMRLNDN